MAIMQPQNSLNGANASTSTPQTMRAPQQLNANAMNNSVQQAQNRGIPTAQAVNQAASNPNNRYYAKGGDVMPPSKPEIEAKLASYQPNKADLEQATAALKGEAGTKEQPQPQQPKSDPTENMFKSYFDQQGQAMMQDRANGFKDTTNTPQKYAKGGPVGDKKDLSLKEIVKMLANHPDVAGQGTLGNTQPMKSTNMAKGGMPTANTQAKSEARSHAKGLLSMNDDVGTYAQGGPVATGESDNEVLDNTAGNEDGKAPEGLLKLAVGGGLEGDTESDNITGYAPDGTPIITNADGTQSEGNINDLLGRPSGASTLGTGATPTSTTGLAAGNTSAANTLGGEGTETQMMAKGGEEAGNPPPGSLKEEVADNIPAKLSGGEFVFSADVVRFYGLRTLNMMMEHARDALKEMNGEGTIRHPGDGKNPTSSDEDGGHFVQDAAPDTNAYNEDDMDHGEEDPTGAAKVSGLLKECAGGSIGMATGGGVEEEQSLAKGGSVYGKDQYPVGRDHMVSAHPKAGGVEQDYANGGIVSAKIKNLSPRPSESLIPQGRGKIPGVKDAFKGTNDLPKMAKGGLLDKTKNIVPQQSIVGA